MSKKSAKFERLKSKYEDLVIEEDAVGIRLQLCCCAEDDDGVPPPCKAAHCPFSHENLCLNGEKARRCIGGIGLSHCDRYRKLWLGLVSWFSLLTLGLTIYGCCSLSDNRSVVRRTYWAAVDGHGFDGESSFSMYVGLTTFIYSNCTFVPGYLVYPKNCQEQIVYYKSAACTDGPLSSVCEACQGVATATWVAAVTNVLGLVLATNGAQIRMRRIADVPIQKLLGMVTDLIGAVTLAASLLDFRTTVRPRLSSSHSAYDWLLTPFPPTPPVVLPKLGRRLEQGRVFVHTLGGSWYDMLCHLRL